MNHEDAEMAEVVVVLKQACENRVDETLAELKAVGLDVTETDLDDLVVNGTIDTGKLAALQQLECVNTIRNVMTYVVDFPKGDPRDLDGDENDDDFEER